MPLKVGPFFLGQPGDKDVQALASQCPKLPFNFPRVGVTKAGPPIQEEYAHEGWEINHNRVQEGAGVVVTACTLFLWSMNPLRITSVEEGAKKLRLSTGKEAKGHRLAFAHTTLAGHQISGEERFAVEWHPHDDTVWYEIYTVSKAATPLAKLASPLLRHYQDRFARDSMAAMQRQLAVAAPRASQDTAAQTASAVK